MTRDLGDLMWGAVIERSRSLDGLAPAGSDLVRLHTRVRRGRTVRHVREAAVAVPVAAAVVAGGWLGIDRLTQPTPPPPATQEPVVPSPDATGDATQETTDEPLLGDPITEPGLPPYYEMPDGLLDRTGPGWVVTSDRPMRDDPAAAEVVHEDLGTALFLVAPDGAHFLVGRFDPGANVYPVAWSPGSPTVDVIVDTLTAGFMEQRPEQDLMTATYDLRTRTFTEREGGDALWPPDTSADVPRSPSGRGVGGGIDEMFTLWAEDDSGTQLAYEVDGKVCAAVGWLDDVSFLALCVDRAVQTDGGIDIGRTLRDYAPVLVRVDLDGARVGGVTELQAIGADDPLPVVGAGVTVRDGVVAFPSDEGSPYGCFTGADAWTGAGFQALQRPENGENVFVVRAAGGVVYVEASPGCSGDAAPATLTAHDLTAGTAQLLEPAPADWRPGEPGWVTQGLVAWVVSE